jgi:rSAM/selenodomain-associated transferase 2
MAAPCSPLISVVIPTLDEADHLPRIAPPLLDQPGVEVIVADGGSRDGTPELARALGFTLVRAPRGRGIQLAAGVARARGELVVLLHADTRLPAGWGDEVRRLLARPEVALGAFRFRLDQRGWAPRLIETFVAWRSRWLGLPYGDQALFLRAHTLRALGGVPPWPLMEDVALVQRARRLGRVVISPLPAVCSARRWQRLGFLRNTLLNWLTLAAFSLGVSPWRLARFYYRHRG